MESEKARAKRLSDNFNLSILEWETVNTFQNHVCFICGHENKAKQRLATDHAHDSSGLVRGLLCLRCNILLGKLENAFKRYGLHKLEGVTLIGVVLRIAEYLRHPPMTQALGREVFGWPGKIGSKAHRAFIKKRDKQKAKVK
jgi:hypothetical protein